MWLHDKDSKMLQVKVPIQSIFNQKMTQHISIFYLGNSMSCFFQDNTTYLQYLSIDSFLVHCIMTLTSIYEDTSNINFIQNPILLLEIPNSIVP